MKTQTKFRVLASPHPLETSAMRLKVAFAQIAISTEIYWPMCKCFNGELKQIFQSTRPTVKPVVNGHSKRDQKLFFKTDYRLMQDKSIAECSTLR